MDRLIISCEHGGHDVPEAWRPLFRGREALLESHRGWDPGALELARLLARRHGAPLGASTVTRLLVELNRSLHHPRLFSEITRPLGRAEKEAILRQHYFPYRERLERWIREAIAAGARAVHVSVHSFTPVLDGEVRRGDLGLLYDPGRAPERAFCHRWRQALRKQLPGLRVRRNYPYLGKADGLTSHLRRRFPTERYLGIELEVNQELPLGEPERWELVQEGVASSLSGDL